MLSNDAHSCYKAAMSTPETYRHLRLDCGMELAALPIDGRRTAAYEIRVLSGLADEPEDKLGLAGIVEETISKGTEQRSARELSDAFDMLGASCSSGVGRESFVFRCSCLPEYVERTLSLHAEMLRTPTFPDEFLDVAIDLSRQELTALEDEPGDLARKLLGPHAFGPLLGRHELGSRETLDRIRREDVVAFWRQSFVPRRMQMTVAGAVDVDRIASFVDRLFMGSGGFANQEATGSNHEGRFQAEFSPGVRHVSKDLEQEQILICWPGVPVPDADHPVERVVLAVLSGGMSSRLFTEVREKRGLVYSVGAWHEHPRGAGRIFMGASSKTERCDQAVQVMLREVQRLGDDVTEDELARAKIGLLARAKTHGDMTRARAGDLSRDLFFYGEPVPLAEKHRRIEAVAAADVRRYVSEHRPRELCIQTLGPRELDERAFEHAS